MKLPLSLALVGTLVLSVPLATAQSSSLYALLDEGAGQYTLASFRSNQPTGQLNSAVSGLASGEVLLGLDFRPATGALYAIGESRNVYTISFSGAATSIGSFSERVPGKKFGFDFNPAFMNGTFARIVSNLDDNRVISGADGSYLEPVEKSDLFYADGDPAFGYDPDINHIAYTNSVAGAASTQQYGIDTNMNSLVTVANNAGTLQTVGSLGVNASGDGGFDIDGTNGLAFAGFQISPGVSNIYQVDLTSGSATFARGINGNIVGLTAVPEPSGLLLTALSGLGLLARRRR